MAFAHTDQADPEFQRLLDSLTRNAAPEDLLRYTPDEITALARLAYRSALEREPGSTLISLIDPSDEIAGYEQKETVLLAVNDDMPFLFDSLMAEASAQRVGLQAVFHPVVQVKGIPTSLILLAMDALIARERRDALVRGVEAVFAQVRVAVRDWYAMENQLRQATARLKTAEIRSDELSESIAFLDWLGDNHFTFLGVRDYAYADNGVARLEPVEGSGLGVLADRFARVVRRDFEDRRLAPEVRAFLVNPAPLIIIAKSNEKSLVHRRVSMDYIGVKEFRPDGTFNGERRFVGLFTSGAYSRSPFDIPLLRLKVRRVMDRANLPPGSHDAKTLAHILDTFPRDELFQIADDELYETAVGILHLTERPKLRAFVRFDRFDRFVSAIVFVPQDRFNGGAMARIHAILARAFDGCPTEATPSLDDSVLARIHYTVARNPGPRSAVDLTELESEMRLAIRTWGDGFLDVLRERHGEVEGRRLLDELAPRVPARYRDAFTPQEGVHDLEAIEALARSNRVPPIEARVFRKPSDGHSTLRIKLYGLGTALPLSHSLPVFENFGLRVIAEDAYPVTLKGGDAFVLDFVMERADHGSAHGPEIKPLLEEAFQAVMAHEAESDGFNRLVINAGMGWRDVTILRAMAKFLRQAAIPFSLQYMEQALSRNPDVASMLVALFHAMLAPDMASPDAAKAVYASIETSLEDVANLDDDRILRRVRNVIANVLRTNFYQLSADGRPKPHLSIKLASDKLDELPAPHPLFDIFVYSPLVEGVHLRFANVARGGLRWSDRREDFRTEVLGLVKAQQVKNACIVPVGAKGGFFAKQLPVNATREEVTAAGIAAYRTFINALLDVTDNLGADGSVVAPDNVVRRDGDDPYFVVAADKGTATFSDIANAIAEDRRFWLGDAFASGGSHGYDHKKMGITARGAWEAVKRHFREMGSDIQHEPFTCVGVGDMSGDVFGNGLLLSTCIKLVAAFDHRHIFVDPDPDPERSWRERKRLFDLPRSSWAEYDSSLISPGGGVFARTLKEIPLSAEIKRLTGIGGHKATPNEIIKALLKADVDLLFLGGIGTYVKASVQTNLDAGDRANDAVRVNGNELRAKVVGEGANLGLTQLGRIEYARSGGRLNTDAIDNSAGVDTSDHEVNLKILMGGPMRRGELSAPARDELLAKIADDVASLVLKDNYDQTLALSVAQSRTVEDADAYCRFIRDLEARGRLDRAVEFLPDDVELRHRAKTGQHLTRPELAVLLAYAKLDLKAELLSSDLPDDPYFITELTSYFPPEVVATLPGELLHHRLRREIIVAQIANKLVNLAGPLFVARMKEMSGAPVARIVRAFAVADGAFDLSSLKVRIDALDLGVDPRTQIAMYNEIATTLNRLGLWFITNVPARDDLAGTITMYRKGVEELRGTFSTLVSAYEARDTEALIAAFESAGAPHDVADAVGALQLMGATPEIALLAHRRGLDIGLVAAAYFAVGAAVGIEKIRGMAARINAVEHWDRLAIRRIVDDLYAGQRALTASALKDAVPGETGRDVGVHFVRTWSERHSDVLGRAQSFLESLERGGEPSIAKLTLANSQIHELADSSSLPGNSLEARN